MLRSITTGKECCRHDWQRALCILRVLVEVLRPGPHPGHLDVHDPGLPDPLIQQRPVRVPGLVPRPGLGAHPPLPVRPPCPRYSRDTQDQGWGQRMAEVPPRLAVQDQPLPVLWRQTG